MSLKYVSGKHKCHYLRLSLNVSIYVSGKHTFQVSINVTNGTFKVSVNVINNTFRVSMNVINSAFQISINIINSTFP